MESKPIHKSTEEQRIGRYLRNNDAALFTELLAKANAELNSKAESRLQKRAARAQRRALRNAITGT